MAMTKKDQDALAAAGKAWTEANARGDKAGMDAAHKQAESIRNSYGYSGGDDGSKKIPTSSKSSSSSSGSTSSKTGGQYVGIGAGDAFNRAQAGVSAADQAELDKWGAAYNNATSQEEKDYAHKMAEAIRAKYGYSGNVDGSDYINLPNQIDYGSFSYGAAPTYSDRYTDRIDEMLDKLLNRDKFSYDYTQDPLWQQYQNQYLREGERAMQDTLGQVSARTGGLASSWAQTAAQQSQNYYASQAADKIPELYQLAYNMYLQDIDDQVRDLGLLEGMSDREYSRYRDTMSDWMNDRDFAYGAYRDDVSDKKYQNEWDYSVDRDRVEDNRYESETAYDRALQLLQAGIMPGEDVLARAGLTASQAAGIIANRTKSSSTGTRTGTKSNGGTDWTGVEDWVSQYGEDSAEDYIGEHYKDLGYSSKSMALAGWNNHMRQLQSERNGGLSDAAMQIFEGLKSMRSQMGSNSAIGNSIAIYTDQGKLNEKEARYLFKYFGYDPDDWFE